MGKRRWGADSVRTASPPSKLRAPPHIRALQDKTISMLFEGANRKNNNHEESNHTSKNFSCDNNIKHMKQMCINNAGGLFFNGVVEETHWALCTMCKSNIDDEIVKCNYCEVAQCVSCAKICSTCKTPTCNNCSINNSGDFDQILCFTCCR